MFFLLFFFFVVLGISTDGASLSVLCAFVVYFMIGSVVEKKSATHMMFFLGYTTFMFLAMLLNFYYLDIGASLYFYTSVVALFFLIWTAGSKIKSFSDYGHKVRLGYFLYSFFACLFLLLYGRFAAPVFGLQIFLMSMSLRQNKTSNYFVLSAFIVTFLLYVVFVWNGFGRTVVFGWLLLSLLLFAYSRGFYVNKYLFALVPGLGSVLLKNRDFFELSFSGFESSLSDSAFSPYRLASTFVNHAREFGVDLPGLLDQIVFSFFVFVPRSIWSGKPYGFGFEYTVQHLDQYLIDAGHSIASTLIGDHLYYLGLWGMFTSLAMYRIIAFGNNWLYSIKGLNGNGSVVFAASMVVLPWGGVTSFSARVFMPLFVVLLVIFIYRRSFANKLRFYETR